MINKFFTLLNREILNDSGRLVETGVYKQIDKVKELHRILVPISDDKYSSLCTEQLLQIILKSKYADRLTELDPLNTYDKDILNLEEDTYTVIHTTALGYVVLNENHNDPSWSERSFTVIIDPVLLKATVASKGLSTKTYSFTMTNNLSAKILLTDEIYLRLQGTLPASDFTISVRYSQKFERDLITLLNRLGSLEIPWFNAAYTEAYFQEDVSFDKLAAIVMNLYEILTNGTNR